MLPNYIGVHVIVSVGIFVYKGVDKYYIILSRNYIDELVIV